FGEMEGGLGMHFFTHVWMEEPARLHLALGAPAKKRAWVNGAPVAVEEEGYLSLTPVELRAGKNRIDVHLVTERAGSLRGYWALVQEPERFRRPEWIEAPGYPVRDGRVLFTYSLELPFAPEEATVQVAA